ncbi:MAG TPA: cyclodeaminase/cyclohydrolase family protein, partial [Bacteroidales bacterium]|nr:cyclodeaminase/cyclohydrolase family protein [Bacteroidales bacterium]
SVGVSQDELIKIAIKSLGLDDLKPFNPREKIIEFVLEDKKAVKTRKLIDMSCAAFADETASESPAPGGGSISAYMGALGASLATMVANLSSHKPGWDERWEEFSNWAEKGQKIKDELLALVDEDTNAFNKIMNAFGLPKGNDQEKAIRTQAIQDATRYAIEVPYKTMEKALASFEIIKAMAEVGNPNSVTDAGVGALCARSAVMGAFLNVKINACGLKDKDFVANTIAKGEEMLKKAIAEEESVLKIVHENINF